jgi:hypothetical protein
MNSGRYSTGRECLLLSVDSRIIRCTCILVLASNHVFNNLYLDMLSSVTYERMKSSTHVKKLENSVVNRYSLARMFNESERPKHGYERGASFEWVNSP